MINYKISDNDFDWVVMSVYTPEKDVEWKWERRREEENLTHSQKESFTKKERPKERIKKINQISWR